MWPCYAATRHSPQLRSWRLSARWRSAQSSFSNTFLAILLARCASSKGMIAGFAVIAAVMLWNAGLSAYHAGVEWKFWPGPADCSGPINSLGSASNMLKQLQDIRIVRCDEAAWRFLGISLAGYDVLVSLFIAAVAGWGLKASLARRSRT